MTNLLTLLRITITNVTICDDYLMNCIYTERHCFIKRLLMLYHFYNNFHIIEQNLSDIEIIIVNDNPSIPLTKDMLCISQDNKIQIVTMPQNGGYAAACNYGVKHSKGELLIFMDSDILV